MLAKSRLIVTYTHSGICDTAKYGDISFCHLNLMLFILIFLLLWIQTSPRFAAVADASRCFKLCSQPGSCVCFSSTFLLLIEMLFILFKPDEVISLNWSEYVMLNLI